MMISRLLLFALLFTLQNAALAAKVKVAVASNFTAPMREIAARFNETSGHKAVVSYGSTGKLFAQIQYGAPFHLFLAADQKHPALIHKAGQGQAPHTYAVGKLALWSSDPDLISDSAVLSGGEFSRLAIANPKTAPYGSGAIQVLDALGVTQQVNAKLVRGDNIAQTYQFVMTGNAQLGFVAISQIAARPSGSHWVPPQSMYQPLKQDAVLLEKGADNPAAIAFMDFLLSAEAKRIAQSFGYGTD